MPVGDLVSGAPGANPRSESGHDSDESARERERLDRSLVKGLAWTSGANWLTQILTWASTLVVARLLTPEDYGLIGMATIYLGLVSLLSEFGLGASVVILHDLSRKQIAQMNGLGVIFGMVGVLLTLAAAKPLAVFFSAPRLPTVMLVMSGAFLVSGFRIVPESLLQRDLEFRLLALINAASALAAAIGGVALAVAGLGYWALVLAYVAGPVVRTGAAVTLRPHEFAWPRRGQLKEALTLSGNIIVSRLAWYGYSTADFLVIGRILGQEALGFYNIGWALASVPVNKVTAILLRVVSSVFSAVQESSDQLRRYFLLLTEALATITFPATVGLALVAPEFVDVVLGDQWTGAVGALQLLAVYAGFRSIVPLLSHVLNVVGDARFEMKMSVLQGVVLTAGFLVGTRWGIEGVAAAWLALHPLMNVPVYLRVFRRIDLRLHDYLRALWPPLSSTVVMSLGVTAIYHLASGSPPVVRLALEVVGGAGIYIGLMLTAHRARLRVLRRAVSLMRS